MIDAVIGSIWFAKITCFATKKKILVYDTMAFVSGSLRYLANELNLQHRKMDTPDGIGNVEFTPYHEYFVEYAKNDVLVTYDLVNWIIEQHRKYDVRICVSCSQFALRVFRHYYLQNGEVIQFPPNWNECVLSYHGGKNGYYLDGTSEIDRCYEVDIRSAYPYALSNLPQMIRGDYINVEKFDARYVGIYSVWGEIKPCRYPLAFTHDFKRITGKISGLCLTSYEIQEGLKTGELSIDRVEGTVWVPDTSYARSPFADYVKYFFEKKETAKSKSEKMLYKILLNSLYGKTYQTINLEKRTVSDDPDFLINEDGSIVENKQNRVFQASGMFNPFIASLVTGATRVYLHRLEHKYQAVHSSTDSIKTVHEVPDIDGLGGLKKELCGRCIIIRNKLYIHYNEKGELKKYALHGFLGDKTQLERVYISACDEYDIKRIFKVRQALRQKLVPLTELHNKFYLHVDLSKVNFVSYDRERDVMTTRIFYRDAINLYKKNYNRNRHGKEIFKPLSLVSYIVAVGGLSVIKSTDLAGEIRIFSDYRRAGLINEINGRSADNMAELLYQSGYLHKESVYEMLDKIDLELRGLEKFYPV